MSKQQERDIEILEIVLRNKQHVNFFADNELGAIQRLLDRVKDLELHCKNLNEGNAITIKAAAQTQEQLGELQQIFDLRFKADMRAIKVWQTATGKDMKLPDHADLCVWLLRQRDAALKLADEILIHRVSPLLRDSEWVMGRMDGKRDVANKIRAIFEPKE